MADPVHDDRLVEAFTRFRSQVGEEVRPPGTDAVRRWVRRRRVIRVACAAMAVALVGAVVAGVTTGGSPDMTVGVDPTLSAADLEELADRAVDDLFAKEPLTASAFPVAVTAQTQGEPLTVGHGGSSPLKFVQGQDYDLVALCLGRGTATVAWEAPGGVTGSVLVVCDGTPVRVRFIPRADGPEVQIRLTPDAEAISRAGIALGYIEFQ